MFQLDDSKSLYRKMLGIHQTSIYKWLFRVPGNNTVPKTKTTLKLRWFWSPRWLEVWVKKKRKLSFQWSQLAAFRDEHLYNLFPSLWMLSFFFSKRFRESESKNPGSRCHHFQKCWNSFWKMIFTPTKIMVKLGNQPIKTWWLDFQGKWNTT